jgi:hypothetical protein
VLTRPAVRCILNDVWLHQSCAPALQHALHMLCSAEVHVVQRILALFGRLSREGAMLAVTAKLLQA